MTAPVTTPVTTPRLTRAGGPARDAAAHTDAAGRQPFPAPPVPVLRVEAVALGGPGTMFCDLPVATRTMITTVAGDTTLQALARRVVTGFRLRDLAQLVELRARPDRSRHANDERKLPFGPQDEVYRLFGACFDGDTAGIGARTLPVTSVLGTGGAVAYLRLGVGAAEWWWRLRVLAACRQTSPGAWPPGFVLTVYPGDLARAAAAAGAQPR